MRVGDFSVRLPRDQIGLAGKIADTFNEIVGAMSGWRSSSSRSAKSSGARARRASG